jgi:polyisoprenoid-binding protein YceI
MTTQTTATQPAVSTWTIDASRSRVTFTVRKRRFLVQHLTVEGRFPEVTGTIVLDAAAPERSHVAATLQTASLDTRNRRRDKHLRSAAFFDVERFPTISFESRAVTPIDPAAGTYRITGELTVRGVTRTVDLDTTVGPERDPRQPRLRFAATTRLDRHAFGLNWNSLLIKIFDEVTVLLEIDALRQ